MRPPVLPEIVAIELPAVGQRSPVPITVQNNAASVRVKLDGIDGGELVDAGGDADGHAEPEERPAAWTLTARLG